jgi:membrane associated rhomboid family serine protease
MQPFTRRWAGKKPSVWAVLIAVNVACYVAQATAESFDRGWFTEVLGLSERGIRAGYYWQFLSYMFLHQGPLHLLLNMVTLFFAAREVESILGPRHLAAIYFSGGVGGGLAQFFFSPLTAPLIGASAGVCAVFIAFTTILPEIELTALLFFIIPVRVKAKHLALAITAISIIFSFGGGTFGGYGHLAHLGGILLGWVYARQLGYGNPLRIQRYVFEKRQRDERLKRMPPGQFVSQEIDPILDKISREGLHSLTRAERRILEKGREKIAQRTARR